MNKRKRILLIAVLTLIICGLGLVLYISHEPPEPAYQGKPLSYWLMTYDWSVLSVFRGPTPQGSDKKKADRAINAMGTNCFPRLFQMLQAHDSAVKIKIVGLLQRQHRIQINAEPAMIKNRRALAAFNALGPSASNAVPRLVEVVNNDPDPFIQQAVPAILSYIGPPAREAVPALLRGMTKTNWLVRYNCAIAVRKIAPEPKLVLSALIKLLDDPVPFVRREAVHTLGDFGAGAQAAVPDLLKLAAKEPKYTLEELGTWTTGISGGVIVLPSGDPNSTLLSKKLQSLQVEIFAREALQSIDPDAAAKAGIK